MAAEAVVTFGVEGILSKVLSLASKEFGLALGFKAQLRKLRNSLTDIERFLVAVANQPQGGPIEDWVKKLKDVAHDAEDVLDEFEYEVARRKVEIQNHMKKKVLNFFSLSNPLAFRLQMAHKIKKINASLVDLKSEAPLLGLVSRNKDTTPRGNRWDRQTNSFIGRDEITVGREEVVSKIVTTLTDSKYNQENPAVMAIVGMGGLGKTTLAKSVYNEELIHKHFEMRIWICVSNTFDVDLILLKMLEQLKPANAPFSKDNQEALLKFLNEELKDKRYLLVLDDVWNEDSEKWKNLMECLFKLKSTGGSKIIITTRSAKVASISEKLLPRHELGKLSVEECWSIMKDRAFLNSSALVAHEFQTIGMEIAENCGGVPLMAKVLGGILYTKKSIEEWSLFKDSRIWGNLPKGENWIMPILKLSFDNLESPSLKQCFAYCSLLKKDSEIQRESLVQLWMAQGLLHPTPSEDKEMEEIGNEYFDILLQSSLFQSASMSDNGIVSKCKMHDLVHDLAEFISKSESLTGDFCGIGSIETRHAARVSTSVLENILERSAGKLRSLFFDDGEVPTNILPRFKALRVLNLSNANIEEFPVPVGRLKHLRYLDISETRFKALPKSIGKLYNLQTLRATNCALKEFPRELQNLTNLRHIYFDGTTKFPQWIRRLTCLRTIPYFSVGNEIGHRIEELADLKELKGELIICNLEHVKNGDEAKRAKLENKMKVRHLTFRWKGYWRITDSNEEEDVLEGLQPHPELESLYIENFMGDKFPSWMTGTSLLLKNLKKIKLLQCTKCEGVPPLGHLPNLTELEIRYMANLKCVGAEFYGFDLDRNVATTSKEKITLFPALKVLSISRCNYLVEWEKAPTMSTQEIVVFPCLEMLTIHHCSKLKKAPSHFPSLQKLEITSGDHRTPIEEISHGLTTLSSLKIKAIKELLCLPQEILKNNNNLSSLDISECNDLTCITTDVFESCRSLKTLIIRECEKLRYFADGLGTLPHLEYLEIKNCPSLELIPITHGMASLRELEIRNCKGLSSLPSGLEYCTSLQRLRLVRCDGPELIPITHGMASLRELEIRDCKGLSSLPSGFEYCTSLQTLRLEGCDGLELIPITHGMASLRELEIRDCKGLSSLPSGLEYCTSLQRLRLVGCDGRELIPITHGMASLRELEIFDCERLSSLPSGLEYCTSLQRLRLVRCDGLELIPITHGMASLRELEIRDCKGLSSLPSGFEYCTSLQRLRLQGCDGVTAFPFYTHASIRELKIWYCNGLSGPLSVWAALVELDVFNGNNLTSIEIKGGVSSLQKLIIRGCKELSSLPAIPQQCPSLQHLVIYDCPKVTSFGVQSSSISLQSTSDLRTMTSLRQLTIEECEGLESWVSGLQFPLSLETLGIVGIPNLEILPSLDSRNSFRYLGIGRFWEELDSFPDFQVGSLMHLTRLNLYGWPKLKSLPQQIQHLTSLTSLTIHSFDGVETLPEWLGNLTSLTHLYIWDCKNLTNLPSVKAMQRLTKLQTLWISGCHPLLKQRCSRDSGTDWPKISHIPEITIDRVRQ